MQVSRPKQVKVVEIHGYFFPVPRCGIEKPFYTGVPAQAKQKTESKSEKKDQKETT